MDTIILDLGRDLKGESSREGFAGKIDLLSFSHAVAMQTTGDASGSERTVGRPIHQDLTVTKHLDSASPVLNQNCCEGRVFPQAEIIVGENVGGSFAERMRYTLKNVIVTAVAVGGGGDKPIESLTLNYTEIRWKYTLQNRRDSVEGRWNLATNQPH